MASSKIKGINIKIGADTQGLSKALSGIEAKSKSAQNELREINRTINSTPKSLVAWQQKQEVLTKAISDSREKVKLLENAQEEVAKQLADGKINGEQYRAFQRELENARSESKKLDGQLQEVKQKIREFGKETEDTAKDTDKLGDSMEDAGKDAEKSSDGYTVLKGVLANLATQGINFAFDKLKIFTQQIIETGKTFEASMSNASAISGATAEEMDKLSEKAKQMGATTKYTASQAADAFGFMALAGWKTEDMLDGIDGVLSLAAASNMDLAKASDIVTDYLTAFGLTAQDSARFVDQMSYAMSNSNTTTEALGEAYKNCAATAASMGYSVEETTAVLMTMANAGVKGGEAGTALNAIMTRLATNTQNCADKIKEYGVHVYDSKGNMQELSSILQGVSNVWSTLTDEQQANLAKSIAGTNHYSALQTIMNGLSDSAKASGMSFTDYAAALEECDGTAQNMANTMIDNLAGDMTILDSSIDGVKIALSEKLNPILRDLVQYITEKMPEIQEKTENIFDTGIDIFNWAEENIPEMWNSLKKFWGWIFDVFPDFNKNLDNILPLITSISTGFVAWKSAKTAQAAITGLIPLIKSLNAAMLANPAAAVAAGIAALGTVIGLCVVQAATDVSELQKISEKIDYEFSDKTKKIDDIKEKISDLNKSFDDSANAIDHEFDRTEILKKELDNLVDASGRVRSEDKKRVDYIFGELNQALGTEYELTGNQIEGYQNLSKEIDNIIEKKQAESLLDAALANSADLLQEQEKLKQKHREAVADREKYKLEEEQAKENYKSIEEEIGISASQFVNQYGSLFEKGAKSTHHEYIDENGDFAHKIITKEQYQAAKAVVDANQRYQNASTRERITYGEWNDVSEQTKQLYDALALADSGKYKEATNLMLGESSDFNAETATEDEMLTEYRRQKADLQGDWQLYHNSQNQSEINAYLNDLVANLDLGQKAGTSLVPLDELLDTETISHIQQLANKNFDLSKFTKFGKDSNIDITEFLGEDYSKILSEQINSEKIKKGENGYNVDDFLEWAAKSKTKIAKEAWDDVAIYAQNLLDKGFDITELIKNGAEAGIDWGTAFNGEYTKIVQQQIDNGIDPTNLINTWSEIDGKAAESFKKNYVDISQDMLDEGFDPTSMLLHFAETDKEFAEDFKKNGKDVIQAMLDKGFDFTELIKGFDLAINDIFNVWDEGFRKKFQKTLGVGSDEPSFFEWGHDINPKHFRWDQLVGENLEQNLNDYQYYLDAKNGRIQNNSAWDAELDAERRRKVGLSRYATGGYISSGNRAIVAEAGPELLEVMNGGIRVTPMRGKSAGENASSSESIQKNFYNTYNINNPKISSDTDIRTLAQKLAAEQRRIERGRGF